MASRGTKRSVSGKARMRRTPIPPTVRQEVLNKSRRRCCMCFGLKGDLSVKQGQLAHLSRDPSNPKSEDLAYLCQECHTLYDTKSNRVLGFTPDEVRFYRDQLYGELGYNRVEWHLTIRATKGDYEATKTAVDKAKSILNECTNNVTLTEGPIYPR